MAVTLSSLKDRKLRRMLRRERLAVDLEDHFGEGPPAELLEPYRIANADRPRLRKIQKKYHDRETNIRRAWGRIQIYLPELIASEPQRILEMSTGHGAMLEVLRYVGHDVLGNDYATMVWPRDGAAQALFRSVNDPDFARDTDDYGLPIDGHAGAAPDWLYRPIVESVAVPVELFDGGTLPYPLPDKSFDVVLCTQALEHYCHPTDWLDIVAEFCRIARRSVFVLLNRQVPALAARPDYEAAFQTFRKAMRDYNRSGFRCTACFLHFGAALGFKLTAAPDLMR